MSSKQRAIHVEYRPGGVAIVWFDVPGEPVNTLKGSFAEDFTMAFDEIEDNRDLKAVVIASAKEGSFIAGADIKMLRDSESAAAASSLSRTGQHAMDRVSKCRVPVVAAIDGPCLGGGLEVALACHGRVASTNPKTRLGLPEVQLGVLPGMGGTQRLPRLIGVRDALDLLLTGKQVDVRKALKLGLVDVTAPAPLVLELAIEHALQLAAESGTRKSGFASFKGLLHADELAELALAENPIGRHVLFEQARKKLLAKTQGNYPAPERILEVVRTGLERGLRRGLEVEAEAFGELAVSPVARELMNIFFAQQALKKDPGIDVADVAPRSVTRVGVLGAGLMGAGVAGVSVLQAGTLVRLKDRDNASVAKGLRHVLELLDERVARHRLTKMERDQLMAHITATTTYHGFEGCEVVIEAVFEDLALKRAVLADIESAGNEETIFASNTSSLPIAEIAAEAKHPERVLGMHYFSPVHKMPLLEVIVTKKTEPWVTATCVELGKRQGKTVIVVRDGVGFYTSRILAPYMNEAAHALSEGHAIEAIDHSLVRAGFPVGPMALLDEVGIDVGNKVAHTMHEAFGARMALPPGMGKLIEDDRLGRKNGRGLYTYEGNGKSKRKGEKPVDDSVYDVVGIRPIFTEPSDEVAERCLLQMVNEAAHCWDDGILRSPRDGDIGAIFGLGFPPFLGGPFRYVDSLGPVNVVRKLERFQSKFGERFAPAKCLEDLARDAKTFY